MRIALDGGTEKSAEGGIAYSGPVGGVSYGDMAIDVEKQLPAGKVGGGAGQPPADRKIIFSADVYLKVADFAKAEKELLQILDASHGFIARADVSGTVGSSRQGTWRVRVPVAGFAEFREAVKNIGEVVRFTADTREVTEEYFDLQSRIKNKEAELESLRKIFDKGSGKIEEVLAVQREVSRAQGELEQMKGRQRVLDNLTELTTVTVHLSEREPFNPSNPLPPVAFGTTLSETFFSSIDVLIKVGKALVIAGAAAAPWAPVVAMVSVVAWLVLRRRRVAVPNVPHEPPAEVSAT
jgi:hypothetical protein